MGGPSISMPLIVVKLRVEFPSMIFINDVLGNLGVLDRRGNPKRWKNSISCPAKVDLQCHYFWPLSYLRWFSLLAWKLLLLVLISEGSTTRSFKINFTSN